MVKGARLLWAALAVVDAIALACVASRFDWGFEGPRVGETPAGWIIQLAIGAIVIALKALAATFVAAVAYAIVMDVRGNWRPPRLAAALLTPAFLLSLALIAWEATRELQEALAVPAMQLTDRLAVFDRLAEAHAPGQSLGAYIALLCLAAYLAEKYLLRWWNLRWPISLAALAIAAWPAWLALRGEADQRAWVAAQQWRAVAENTTWLEALAACQALGPEWRLPRRFELSLYLATAPEALRGWRGSAWTPTQSELGHAAVVVALEPRRGGYWRSNLQPWRDRSLCEHDAGGNNARVVTDWFSDLRPHFCGATSDYEGLHASTVQLIAEIRGSVVGGPEPKWITRETAARAICVKPAQSEIAPLRHRRYPKEEDFRDPESFLARMRSVCNPRAPGSDAAACAAFGAEPQGAIAR
jgi:hypothetical protein